MSLLSFKQISMLPVLLLIAGASLTAQESNYNFDFNHSFNFDNLYKGSHNPCKVFIGVGTSRVDGGGLKVDYTIDDTPARQYGVQTGDVILALDGIAVNTQSELMRERDKHQQGEAFSLKILRGGQEMTINARFKECSKEEQEEARQNLEQMEIRMARHAERMAEHAERMAEMEVRLAEQFSKMEMTERPILGVYENSELNVQGLAIGSVIEGKGAEAAGLQAGDVVTSVDGKTVTGTVTLRGALANHKPGDQVNVVYLRDGKTIRTNLTLSADKQFTFNYKVERDPCKVFIGVYTSGHAFEGRGCRVDGVIDDTPAKISAVQPGDIIMALNGQAVSSHNELTQERDKNKPGDAFTLSVLRDGKMMEINARFKSCDTPGKEEVEEKVEIIEPSNVEERESPKDNTLSLEVLEAYPSPTFGPVNIHFEAEAVPTTVRIFDVAGKAVYSKNLPQFNGYFSEQVDLSNNKPGNFVLSIQQGEKVRSKQLVLMTRA